jgi:pimeloyl-ACP methyl ester carboxylesterase
VLLSTSLAEDRDGTRSGFKPFKALADHLADHGIASIRWDDRGMGESTGVHTHQYTVEGYVDDALAVIGMLRSRHDTQASGIGLLGISQGGLLGPMTAARSRDVAHVVRMSGPVLDAPRVNVRYRRRVLEGDGRSPEELERLAGCDSCTVTMVAIHSAPCRSR